MNLIRKSLGFAIAGLMAVSLMSPVAQAAPERIVSPEERSAYVQEFFQDGDATPLVSGSGGLTDAEIETFHRAVRDAEQAGPLSEEIIVGEMLSDKIVLPPQVDKITSDEAEVVVAQQQGQPQTFATTSATCHRFIFTAYDVCGAILQRYNQLGNLTSFLLDPIGPQIQNPDGVGFHQQFRNGFIFWHPDTGAHAITARNAEVYQRNGWSAGWMGYPLGGEVPVSGLNPIDGELNGWVQLFQGGRIYRTPVVEGFQVASINGLILDRWLELGGANSALGLPIADEAVTPDGEGRYSIFQHGMIYWHPQYGAHEVRGVPLLIWGLLGYEAGSWGYPVGGLEIDARGVESQSFQYFDFDAVEYFLRAGTRNYAGVETNNAVADTLEKLSQTSGIDLENVLRSANITENSQGDLQTARATSVVVERVDNGGMAIPADYRNLAARNTTPQSNPGLHDYCTHSPNAIPIPTGVNRVIMVNLQAPCAIHDLCYDRNPEGNNWDRMVCDNQFRRNISTVCDNVFQGFSWSAQRNQCKQIGWGYFWGVAVAHPEHYF